LGLGGNRGVTALRPSCCCIASSEGLLVDRQGCKALRIAWQNTVHVLGALA
jgi:hypothetical protein